jgi:putative ABC transport system substrate-binding protein
MKRREFITLLGGAAALWPLAARAQQSAMPVIGYVYSGSRSKNAGLPGFEKGLSATGYVVGRNVAIEYRFADGDHDRLPAIVADLVSRGVALIFAADNASAVAVKTASSSIPIVFWIGGDPVKLGLVVSLARPGGNITGVSALATAVVAKRFQLMHDMVPNASTVGILVNPTNPQSEEDIKGAQDAVRALGLMLHVVKAGTEREIDVAFGTLLEHHVEGLVIEGDPFLAKQREQLITLASRHKLPAIYSDIFAVDAGGLMSYTSDVVDQYRDAAVYAGRIMKGEKPANLPVQQASNLRLRINRKTADTLGLAIAPQLYNFADEVIE